MEVGAEKPKHPFVDSRKSALMALALQLKASNPRHTGKQSGEAGAAALRKFLESCQFSAKTRADLDTEKEWKIRRVALPSALPCPALLAECAEPAPTSAPRSRASACSSTHCCVWVELHASVELEACARRSGCLTSLSLSCVANNRVRYAELESIREQTASPLEFIQGYAKQL